MNAKLVKGYLLGGLTVLILVAAAVLLISNAGNAWELHVYFKTVSLSRSLILLLAGAGGLALYWTFRRLLPAAVRALRAGRRKREARGADERLPEVEQKPPDPA